MPLDTDTPKPKKGTMHNAALVAMILLDNDQRLAVLRHFCHQCAEERERCKCRSDD